MAAAKYQKGEILEKYTPDFESHPDYYSLLAYSYLKTNRIRESINIYKQLVLFDPTNASWWIGLGIAYQSHSQPKNALDALGMHIESAVGMLHTLSILRSKFLKSARIIFYEHNVC